MTSAGGVSVYVVLCVIGSLHAVTSDSRFLNRLNLGGSMTKIGETFIVSSSFAYHFVLEMPNKMGVEAPPGRQICVGVHDTGYANTTFDNRCIRDIPAELQNYAKHIYKEINSKIDQITNMLPLEIYVLPRGGHKNASCLMGWVIYWPTSQG